LQDVQFPLTEQGKFIGHFKRFFECEGSIAILVFETKETMAFLEAAQQAKTLPALGCIVIQLNMPTFEQTRQCTHEVMSQIAARQAMQAKGSPAAKYLLCVSETDHFTAERFDQLKKTIQSFPSLDTTVFVALSHDILRHHKIGIGGIKIVFLPPLRVKSFAESIDQANLSAAHDPEATDRENPEKEADHSLFHWSYLPHVLSLVVLVVLGVSYA
jgi:hypothetical protein